MEERNVFCGHCGTENEPQYVYCKNCGAMLKKSEGTEKNTEYTNGETYAQTPDGSFFTDGIPPEEMMSFIGKNAMPIMKKIETMRMKGSKISWCWPVAILAFLFGPLGAALWFFYRKMHKTAWIFVVIGIITSFVTGAISLANFPINIPQSVKEALFAIQTAPQGDELETVERVMEPFYEAIYSYENEISTTINDVVTFASAILGGMFAFSIYKRKAVETIYKYRKNNSESKYFHFGLASIGGTSSGMLTLGILIMLFLPLAVSIILALFMLF